MATEKLIEWSDDLSIGIREIDKQHKVLVDLLNELHDAIRHHKGREESAEVLEKLIEYTRVHFATEESVMSVLKYPGLTAHKTEHERLLDEVIKMKQRFEKDNKNISLELLHFLKFWLQDHIMHNDMKIGAFIHKHEQKNKPNWFGNFFKELFH